MDGFDQLPEELQRIIAFKITDLSTVLKLEELSSQYRAYAQDVTELTTDKFREISLDLLIKFSHIKYIDHQIVLEVKNNPHHRRFVNQLKKAHFVVESRLMLINLLSWLAKDGYYKISYRGNMIYGIIIYQGYASVLYSQDTFYTTFIEPELEKADFQIVKRLAPGMGTNSPKFINQDLRNVLQFTDFGLVNPLLPPSETNPPLVTFTKVLGEAGLLSDVLYSYLITMYKLYWGQPLVDSPSSFLPDVGQWLTIQEVANYEPIHALSLSEFKSIQRVITSTLIKYFNIPVDAIIYRPDDTLI